MDELQQAGFFECKCGHPKSRHARKPLTQYTADACVDCDCMMYSQVAPTLADIIDLVKHLHAERAMHVKRGFCLSDLDVERTSNHLLEEAIELQAEVLEGHRDGVVDESADVLATWLHLLQYQKIDFQEVLERCRQKLLDVFTFDPEDVLTTTPGYSRRHRQDE